MRLLNTYPYKYVISLKMCSCVIFSNSILQQTFILSHKHHNIRGTHPMYLLRFHIVLYSHKQFYTKCLQHFFFVVVVVVLISRHIPQEYIACMYRYTLFSLPLRVYLHSNWIFHFNYFFFLARCSNSLYCT